MRALVVVIVAITGVGPAAHADDPPLAGPRVDRPGIATAPTLVERDFDGRLKRLEGLPVEAALDRMNLTGDERDAALKPLRARSLAIEKILRENLKLVIDAQAAFKPGDDGRGQRAVVRLYELAQPVLGGPKPLDLAAAELDDDHARELRRIVGEYTKAAVEDRMAGHVDGKKADRFGAFVAENAATVFKEIELAAKRVFEGGDRDFQELSRKLELTPEQESKIQAMFIEMATAQNGPPDKMKQLQAMLSAYALLTDDQRARLRQHMAQEARDAARAKRESSKSKEQQGSTK